MKGPQAILAEYIAGALADFFVIDKDAMETSLLDDAGIVLRNTKLRPQTVHFSPLITIQVEGMIESVAFQWHWGKGSEAKGGSDWVRDVRLTISGMSCNLVLAVSESATVPINQETTGRHGSEPESQEQKNEMNGFMAYVHDQVHRIINTVELAITDLHVELQLPSGESLLISGTGFDLKSLGMIPGEPLNQQLECQTLFLSIIHKDGNTYPLLEPICYKAQCIRVSGQRFLSGIEKGLKVVGESTDHGIIIHVCSQQILFVNELLGILLSIKPPEAGTSDSPPVSTAEKSTQPFDFNEQSSFFELPLSAISLVFPNNTKISLSGLIAKYQMDGSILKVEGRDGVFVNDFPVFKLDVTSLWCLDLVNNEFIVWNPEETGSTHDTTVAFFHVRQDELQSIQDGIDEVLAIFDCLENGAASTIVNNDMELPDPSKEDPWSVQLQGRIGFLWEGDDDVIDAEFFVRDVVAISEPASVLISAVDQLYIPGILRLSKPIENSRMTFDGSVFDVQIGDIVATLEEEIYTPPVERESPKNESTSFVNKSSTLSLSDSEHLTTKSQGPFVMPFGVMAKIHMMTLFKIDGQTRHLTVIDTLLAMGPHRSLSQTRNEDFGGIRLALTMERIIQDMIRLEKPRISAVVHPEDMDTIPRFTFEAKGIVVSAGYTARDWKHLIDFRSKSSRKRKKMKKKAHSESNKPIYLPFAHIQPLKVRVVVSSDVVGVKDSSLNFKAFQGKRTTTSEEVIGFYASRVLSKVPNMIVNAELFGTGVVDTVAGSYGGATGAVAMSHLGVVAGPIGGILGVAAFDGIRNTIKAGKMSRGAEEDDNFQLLDIARGLKYAAVRATRGGAAKRGKTDDQRGDPIDWAVGATTDVAKYTVMNKSRLGSAGAGTVGFMYGMMFGGPVGAVAGAVVATVVASKAINKVDSLANRASRISRRANKAMLAIEEARAVSEYDADGDVQEVEFTISDHRTKQMAELEASNSYEACLSDNPIPVRGVLLKRRQFCVWDWRAHYFVLDDGELQYFPIRQMPSKGEAKEGNVTDHEDVLYIDTEEPLKVLNVGGLSVHVDDALSIPSEELFAFTITRLTTQKIVWVLGAGSEETRHRWVTQIQLHVGDSV